MLALRDWYRDPPEARPLGLALFHTVDRRLFGIDYDLPPMAPTGGPDLEVDSPDVLDHLGPHPGYYAISVNFLRGMTFGAPDGQRNWVWIGRHDAFTYFQHFRPIARAGYSIYIYNIPPEEADATRRKMGLPTLGRPDFAPQGRARPETGMQPGHGGR